MSVERRTVAWVLLVGLVGGCGRAKPVSPAVPDGARMVPPIAAAPPVATASPVKKRPPGRIATVGDTWSASGPVVDCAEGDGAPCGFPPCAEGDGVCETLLVTAVGAADLAEGPLFLPLSAAQVSESPPGPCVEVSAVATEAVAGAWDTQRAVAVYRPASGELPEGFVVSEAWALDLDGDGSPEKIVVGEVEGREQSGVIGDHGFVVLTQDATVEAADPDDEQAVIQAMIQSSSARLLGVVDVGLDGRLELLIETQGYEAYGVSAMAYEGAGFRVVGSMGCAV